LSYSYGARLIKPIKFFFNFDGGIALVRLNTAFNFYSGETVEDYDENP
jgi:hypothetical protein